MLANIFLGKVRSKLRLPLVPNWVTHAAFSRWLSLSSRSSFFKQLQSLAIVVGIETLVEAVVLQKEPVLATS